jgi:hypothetical protein
LWFCGQSVASGSPSVRTYLSTLAHFGLAGVPNLSDEWWCKEILMSHEVYYQFPQTPGQSRRVGARGGNATARNRRERLVAEISEQQAREPEPQVHGETTAAAIAFLDAQYPWLRGAENGSRNCRIAQSASDIRRSE